MDVTWIGRLDCAVHGGAPTGGDVCVSFETAVLGVQACPTRRQAHGCWRPRGLCCGALPCCQSTVRLQTLRLCRCSLADCTSNASVGARHVLATAPCSEMRRWLCQALLPSGDWLVWQGAAGLSCHVSLDGDVPAMSAVESWQPSGASLRLRTHRWHPLGTMPGWFMLCWPRTVLQWTQRSVAWCKGQHWGLVGGGHTCLGHHGLCCRCRVDAFGGGDAVSSPMSAQPAAGTSGQQAPALQHMPVRCQADVLLGEQPVPLYQRQAESKREAQPCSVRLPCCGTYH